jgi:hypothetical protein
VQAIARRGDGRVINVSPLWTLQCLSSGPDQMLRQLALTAKRTMTRAGDVNGGLDRGAAIREPGPPGPVFFFVASVWWPDMADLGRH